MIELDTKYKTGPHTFAYLGLTYGWWLFGFGIGFGYLAYAMYFGTLNAWTVQLLANNPQWFLDVGMLSQWAALIAISFVFVGFLRASVMYRKYSFYVDDHAFHLRRGLFSVQEITIPYQQISNVHIEQPYHWRLFGLAQLDITISSSRNSLRVKKRRDFLIPCIDTSIAKDLSRFLVKRAAGEDDDEEESDDEDSDVEEQEDGEDVSIEE